QRTGHVGGGHGLPAAGGDGARAGRDDVAAFQQRLDHRVVLELLERFPGPVVGILVVQPGDVADGHLVVLQVVDVAAAVGAVVRRPTERVHDPAGRHPAFGQLPQFLDADRVRLRVVALVELELLHQPLGQVPARALGQHGHLRLDVDALGVAGLVRTILGDAHVADAYAQHRAL